ncbi:hypothetical protein B0J17DRAFT_709350 [Rhizoctonia solani]|nr:hypothetical protein B0J17DRAFT_709350 [Rhizoctonia solani]
MTRYSVVPPEPTQLPGTSTQFLNTPSHLPSKKPLDGGATTTLHLGPDYGKIRLGIRSKILLPTLVVFIMTTGLGIVVIAWLLAKNKLSTRDAFDSGYTLADEGIKEKDGMKSRIYIGNFTNSHAPSFLPYWLDVAQRSESSGRRIHRRRADATTISWYGMLIEVLTSPSIISLADLWLYATTSAVLYSLLSASGGPPIMASLTFNETVCNRDRSTICASNEDAWGLGEQQQFLAFTGLEVVSNSSADRKVITLADADDLAITVPAFFDEHASFIAPNFGIRANFKSLQAKGSGCDSDLTGVNCSRIGITLIPTKDASFTNVVFIKSFDAWDKPPPDLSNGLLDFSDVVNTANPVESLLQLRWPNRSGFDRFNPVNDAIFTLPYYIAGLYAACTVTIYYLAVSYNGNAQGGKHWGLAPNGEVPSTPFFASSILGAFNWNLVSDLIATNFKSRALTSNTTEAVMAALNQEVSHLSLAMVSGVFYFTPTENVQISKPTILGRYPLAPLLTFVLLLFAYGLMALITFLMTFRMRSGTVLVPRELQNLKSTSQEKTEHVATLEFAQFRLTSPIPTLIQSSTQSTAPPQPPGPDDPDARSVSQSIVDMFREHEVSGCPADRLRFGLENTTLRPRFGVWRDQEIKDKT